MLRARAASAQPERRAGRRKSRIGLALAGGGPVGGVYEIGALLALTDALDGVDFNALDIYVGVSSGSFIAAGMANQISPAELYRIYIENASPEHPVSPETFLRPALREYYQRVLSIPEIVIDALWRYLKNPFERGLIESLQGLSRAIPTGVFDNAAVGEFLRKLFSAPGRSDDFHALKHRLYLVATNLDTGESVEFGAKGWDHVPISKAVQASAALPGLFPPVIIDGHYFVDGALKKTLHASVALRNGANLVICVNPLVPYDAKLAAAHGKPDHEALIEGGLPVVLSQTFRSMIHSRMQVGMAKYDTTYKNADIILFEPDPADAEMFFTNIFSYANRRRLCDHAYRQTLMEIARRRRQLAPILARHGITIRARAIAHPGAHISTSAALRELTPPQVKAQLAHALHGLRTWLHAHEPKAPRRAKAIQAETRA